MPITKSAMKRIRTSEEKRIRNLSAANRIKRARKDLYRALAGGGDAEKSRQKFNDYCSLLDKAAKKGFIKKNTANRYKSNAAARLRAVGR